jgi:hypothetical protein
MRLHDAIYKLNPSIVIIDGHDGLQARDAQGNSVEYDLAAAQEYALTDVYKDNRKLAYPSIFDQLDMLWHAIDSGTLNKTSDFYTTIKSVKDAHPKE